MGKQMCWLLPSGGNQMILHLRYEANQPWKPYTYFSGVAVADYKIPGGSKGWATYQKLLKAGWKLIPTAEAQNKQTDSSIAA